MVLSPDDPITTKLFSKIAAARVVTVMVFSSYSDERPSSVTRTVKTYSCGPCSSVGVHVKTPVFGSIAAPYDAPRRLNVRVFAIRAVKSESVAIATSAVTIVVFKTSEGFETLSIGATLMSLTLIDTVREADESTGAPLS